MGHREVVLADSLAAYAGASTVRIGRWLIVEMGGPPIPESRRRETFSDGSSDWTFRFVGLVSGKPDIVGGGNSRPSFAFLESWRAKSDACHHSRNFRAKIDVGNKIFRLESSLGYTVCVMVRGLNIEFV